MFHHIGDWAPAASCRRCAHTGAWWLSASEFRNGRSLHPPHGCLGTPSAARMEVDTRGLTFVDSPECKEYLVENSLHSRCIWPSFLWHILSMGNKSTFEGEYKYFSVYSGGHLWSLIPQSMRLWWIDAVKNITFQNNIPYEHIPMLTLTSKLDAKPFF